jgi:hypothetical protein
MTHRSVIRGAPRIQQRSGGEYWTLVQQLMTAGWYRLGPGRDPVNQAWGFRRGHTLARERDGMNGGRELEECWIEAKDELTAMHSLLRSLEVRERDGEGESRIG